MANLYFPQLATGAVAQYPIRKMKSARTIKNVLPDGTMILYPDARAARLVWELSYTNLSIAELAAIQAHFNNCVGRFHAFTFIDPTDNMLVSSSDLTTSVWETSTLIRITPGARDTDGKSSAFTVTNTSDANQVISQSLAVPANFRYCFSLYVNSDAPSTITLIRSGISAEEQTTVPVTPSWTRVLSSGQLNDSGTMFTVGISLAAGQQVTLYGLQLEPQMSPSSYHPTMQTGGVYPNAHWAVDELTVIAEAPALFSTSFSIETAA